MVLARYCEPVAVRHTVRSLGAQWKAYYYHKCLGDTAAHCSWFHNTVIELPPEVSSWTKKLYGQEMLPLCGLTIWVEYLTPNTTNARGVAQHWRLLMVNANIDSILYKQQLYWIFDVALIRQDSVLVLTLSYQRLPEKCKLCRKSEAVRVCLQRYRHNKQRRGLIRGDILLPNLITLWWDRTNVTILSEWLLLMPLMRLSVPKVAGTT